MPGTYETVIVENPISPHIARITLNRPEKLNAFNRDLSRDFLTALDEIEDDEQVKVVIIRGAGRAFSSGADLGHVGIQPEGTYYGKAAAQSAPAATAAGAPAEPPKRPRIPLRHRLQDDRKGSELQKRLQYFNKVTIAQVHGYALGIGFMYMLQCDMIVAAEGTKLGHPVVRITGPGVHMNSMSLILKLGLTLAKDLDFTGRLMDAKEAFDRSVVTRLVPATTIEEDTLGLAQSVSHIPADGLAVGKATFRFLMDQLGTAASFDFGYVAHTLASYVHYEPDEVNFSKMRRDLGTRGAIRARDQQFVGLDRSDAAYREPGQ
jgi:enoyl-CoA hydratase